MSLTKQPKKNRTAIRLLDYRPNHAERMLTGQLSRSISLIVPDIADTFFSVIIDAVQETARKWLFGLVGSVR